MIMGANRCHLIDIIVNFKLKGARGTGSFFCCEQGVCHCQ